MIYDRLRVFVSSRMQELAPERRTVKAELDELEVDAWVFEADAGARPHSIEQTFLEEVERADLYLGLFWNGYGRYTIDEYEHARRLGKDCLIYEKRTDIEGTRDPQLQAFLDTLGDVETGLTVQWFETPEDLVDRVKVDVARLQRDAYRRQREARSTHTLPVAVRQERRHLLVLLEKVRRFWIEGVLEHSVHEAMQLEVDKTAQPDAVDRPWDAVVSLPEDEGEVFPPGRSLGAVFDDVGRSLLILGGPGSGKTVTLLTLARDLLGRAAADAAQPVPVVFHLSTWAAARRPLTDWLVDELRDKYQMPARVSRPWLDESRLVVLLDGLDEVAAEHRAACVEAINAFATEAGLAGLAVCSREEEYTALPVRLRVTGAIRLQPLTPAQVAAYLTAAGPHLHALREALQADAALRELARSPLMLSVMSLVYQDGAAGAGGAATGTLEDRRRHLFATYVAHLFERRGEAEAPFAPAVVKAGLGWLAQQMQQHRQSVFLIERMQPSWLAARLDRWLYAMGSRLAAGLVLGGALGLLFWQLTARLGPALQVGLLLGGLGGVVAGALDALRLNHSARRGGRARPAVWRVARDVLLPLLAFALVGAGVVAAVGDVQGLIFGFLLGLVFGLFFLLEGNRHTLRTHIQTVEALGWSWQRAGINSLRGAGVGAAVGLLFGLAIGLVGETVRPAEGVLFAVPGALLGALLGAFFGGMRGSVLEAKTRPNEGIRLSFRNALLAAGLVGGPVGLAAGLVFDAFTGCTAGLIAGVLAGFWYGGLDVLQHLTLRLLLRGRGRTPHPFVAFLDYAAHLIFLQKVGGGYLFIHRYLLEHFAAQDEAGPPA